MTTSDLIRILQKYEYGASGRSRELTILVKDKKEGCLLLLKSGKTLVFDSSGDGVAGPELSLSFDNNVVQKLRKKINQKSSLDYIHQLCVSHGLDPFDDRDAYDALNPWKL